MTPAGLIRIDVQGLSQAHHVQKPVGGVCSAK
jgi:hypothetical protein